MSTPSVCPGLEAPAYSNGIHPGMAFAMMTATTVAHVFTSYSAEAKVKALRKLLTQTQDAHKESIDELLLGSLPKSHENNPEFKGLRTDSILLGG